jgi:kynurenine formamidase
MLVFVLAAAACANDPGAVRVSQADTAVDELGNGATQGALTQLRAVAAMVRPGRVKDWYELSHLYSAGMPRSPFASNVTFTYHPTAYLPPTLHAANGEDVCGEIAGQGTQMDALGHFAYIDVSTGITTYLNGFTQDQMKPTPDAPLQHLGIEHAPPIVTSMLLLDARRYMNGGQRMAAGQQVTAADIQNIIAAEGLRPILPGDALFVYTGWEDLWSDDNPDPVHTQYYSEGPGLSYDAALYLQTKKIVIVGLDNPFTDAVPHGFIFGQGPPPAGAPPGLPFAVHHNDLTQAGIHQIQNLHLSELAADQVYLSAVMVLPLRIKGGAGSPIRPVAIGAPWR